MSDIALLCIDDERTILESLRIELETALGDNYQIEMAQDADEALEVLSDLLADNYDVPLAIADYIMPGLKGDELLQHIHALSPKTRTIMLTGQADVMGVTNAINYANLYRYIAKPWQVEDLILTVREAIYSYFQEQALEERTTQLETVNQSLSQAKDELENYAHTLERSEEKFRQLAENIQQVFWISTPDTRQVLYASPAYEEIWGRSLESLYADIANWVQTIHPDDWEALGATLKRQTRTGTGYDIEYRIVRPDGAIRWIRDRSFPIRDKSGVVYRMAGIADDITQRKQAEREREHLLARLSRLNQELEEANQQLASHSHTLEQKVEARTAALNTARERILAQEKLASLGTLTAGVAHELRNPLNFVKNFAEGSIELARDLLEELQPALDALEPETRTLAETLITDLQDNATTIHDHSQRAAQIIDSMMQHTPSNAQNVSSQPIALNSLLARAIKLVYHSHQDRDSNFDLSIQTDYGMDADTIEGIPGNLMRAFINLFDNACDTMRQKQKQRQDYTPTLAIATRFREDGVEIRIRDNGCGIDPEIRGKILDPFFTTKPPGEGTGLGLSLTHDIIVKQHRGTLNFDTQPGEFTEIVLKLPLNLK
ncbi:MAG: PAS domain-containing protein [Spirulina sp.]